MCGVSPGSKKTYEEQVCMPINGKVRCIDKCIHQIVASLNAGGVTTVACCCGHNGKHYGQISLEDGRELIVMTKEEMKHFFTHYPKFKIDGVIPELPKETNQS